MTNSRVLAVMIVLLTMMMLGCNKVGKHQAEIAVDSFNLATTVVAIVDETGYTEVTGTVEGRTVVPVSTKLMSEITFMGFEEGDRVRRGDLLVRVDDNDITAMRAEAAAYRAEAAAVLAEVEAAVAYSEAGLDQAEAALSQARASLVDATRDAERYQRLAEEDTVPRATAEKHVLGQKVAEENVAQAESAVAQAKAGIDQARAKAPQVDAKSDQADAKDAQAAALQDYTKLVAPFDGVITSRLSEPGQLSIPGSPIYMVTDDATFRVVAQVAEGNAGNLAVSDQVIVVYEDNGAERSITGSIAVISAAASPGSHTVRIEIDIDPAEGMFSGRFVRVRIPSGRREILKIPASALVREGDLQYVWRVSSSNVVNRAAVEIGEERDGMLPVIRGLAESDQIVTAPTGDLFPGARLQ